ncbi:HAD family hydrolase [Microbacterium murale]|uniref:FMN phosphatase YigB (HAD superfamily) n=1 Tax=Microbacterium murale TaxID=1081040 RepID=A0ABU0PF85_9MICO|nr:HAD-IA family hydrolase [Microbacterium murale]MDQ0645356.1 FMN phosphatase YigB (HAD superfamily) [Microbacterium murale]
MKWILYDIGGVIEIVDDHSWPAELRTRWSTRFGLLPEEYDAKLAAADLPDTTVNSGVVDQHWRGVADALGLSDADVESMQTELWDAYCGAENSELLDHARSLRGRSGLAILSNSGDGAREEEERRFGLSQIFAPICYSHEQGVLKPEARAFELALDRMGTTADRVLFIDDNLQNVQAAHAVGIRAIMHHDNATTIDAIEEFLADE